MRTVKRQSHNLNSRKLARIKSVCKAYAAEKRYWLEIFARREDQERINRHREIRDQALAEGYVSPHGLQNRLGKLALIGAAETWDRYWQSIFAEVRSRIYANESLSEEQRHYLFWLLED